MLGVIVLVIGIFTFTSGIVRYYYLINDRIDELEERIIFNDICSRH